MDAATPDRDRRTERGALRAMLDELAAIERPSASEGEREAAEWIVARLGELGAEARIETEPAHGTYWWPLGIGAAAGAVAGLAALRGRRLARGARSGRRPRRRSPTSSRPASAGCATGCRSR